jgi:hypothetical protein
VLDRVNERALPSRQEGDDEEKPKQSATHPAASIRTVP